MSEQYIRKTKIVCTVGPACDDDEMVRELVRSGMNVARFNFSHGTHAEHKERMDRVRRVSAELDIPVALLLDTRGPEIRTGETEGGGLVEFKQGQTVRLTADGAPTAPYSPQAGCGCISLTWHDLAARAVPGTRILIADGLFELDVEAVEGKTVRCIARNSAKIGSRKNVNLVGVHSGLPIMGEQDKKDLAFGAQQNVDFIAASFLSFPRELTEIREYTRSLNWTARIIAKIESGEGLENIEAIAAEADGVMVARGDLAVQIPDEMIPLAQKQIIATARRHCKPVITATQMLDSMIINPRPTRAELTDVANAIFDGSDAVMLSGETASGAYPVESVRTLDRIARTIEQSLEYRSHMRNAFAGMQLVPPEPAPAVPGKKPETAKKETLLRHNEEIARVVSRCAYETALALGAKVILTSTLSGNTARQIAMYRPEQPILAITPEERTSHTMLLDWGVIPRHTKEAYHSDEMIQNALRTCAESGLAGISDKIVLAAGLPLESPLPLNTIRVLIVGNVLAASRRGGYANKEIFRARGKIVWAETADEARVIIKSDGGDILVCPALTDDYIPILRIVRGVICEKNCRIPTDILAMVNPELVWLTGVHNASLKLESGLSVTIDGKALLVYEGAV